MGRRFYTADTHFGHRKVAELRGFASTDEHDAALIAAWYDAVGTDDAVWFLGDLAMASTVASVRRTLGIIDRLPGRKHLVAGNHDPVHPMHRDAHRWQRTYLEVFDSVQPFARHVTGPAEVLLSNLPYVGDHTEQDRHAQYRLRDEGRWLLHGHTHANNRHHSPRQIHVGLDGWDLRPVDETAILELITGRS